MGRAQQRQTNNMNDANAGAQNQQYQQYNQTQAGIGNQNQTNANSAFGGAMGNYDYLSRGFTAEDPNYGGGGSGGGGSHVGAAGYTAKHYDATGYESKAPAYQLKAIDPSNMASAKAGYDEYAKTGGMDDASRENFRLRGNATLPSFYSNLKNNMANRRNVQGGYGSGFDAADAELARNAARSTYQGAIGTEGALQDRITAGRQFGIAGQSDVGKFADDLQLRHDTTQGGFQDAYADRQDRAGMFSAGAKNDAGAFNANADNQAGAFNASASNSASAANAGIDERAREFNASEDSGRRTAAGSGYSGLYSDSNNAAAQANARWLGGLNGNSGAQQSSINSRFEYNKPWGQQLANQLVGGATAAAGTYFGGGMRRRGGAQ